MAAADREQAALKRCRGSNHLLYLTGAGQARSLKSAARSPRQVRHTFSLSNSMDTTELLAAAQRLARPCVLLKHSGPADRLAGVWGGPSVVACPSGPFRHWLSIDCRFLPALIGVSSGVISVFSNQDDCKTGVVEYDPSAKLPASASLPLFAHEGQSLPPPDAMPSEEYERYLPSWQSNCPLYTNEAAAVLGGWHFPWPDDDWVELQEKSLLLWTIEESEPWIEVWKEIGGFRVIQRIT